MSGEESVMSQDLKGCPEDKSAATEVPSGPDSAELPSAAQTVVTTPAVEKSADDRPISPVKPMQSSPQPQRSSPTHNGVNLDALPSEEAFQEAQDFSSEPIEVRLASKDLNRRCSAYTEMHAQMTKGNVEAFSTFAKYVTTCFSETLPKGQDAALSALLVYLEQCPGLESKKDCPTLKGIIKLMLEHKTIDKPKLQQLSIPVVLSLAEICECPFIVKELIDFIEALENSKKKSLGVFKKQVAFAIKLLSHLLEEFGPGKVIPKLGYLPLLFKYVADTDRGIKEACYSVLVELSAWMDVTDLTSSLADAQKKELGKRSAEYKEKAEAPKAVRRRYRTEKANINTSAGQDPGKSSSSAATSIDTYDMVEAVDVAKKLPKGWNIDKVFTMEKWKEKQDHLQELSKLLDVKRLLPSDLYSTVMPALVRLVKSESNIPVLQEAAKCIGLMACGLRKDFERHARQCLPVLVARIIDKSVWKQNVLVERVEQLLYSIPFEICFEELTKYIHGKSPFAKKEAFSLIIKALDLPAVQLNSGDVSQKLLSSIAGVVLPAIDDSDNSVRREAAKLLAMLTHRNISSPDVCPLLVDKVPVGRRNLYEEEWKKLTKEPLPGKNGNTSASTPTSVTPAKGCNSTVSKTPRPLSQTPRDGHVNNISFGGDVSPMDAQQVIEDLVGSAICAAFDPRPNATAVKELEAWWESNRDRAEKYAGHLVVFLHSKTQGFKDNRPIIMKQTLTLLTKIPRLCGINFHPWVCRGIVGAILEKALDKKVGADITDMFADYAAAAGLDIVVEAVVKYGSQGGVAAPMLEQVLQILHELLFTFGPEAFTDVTPLKLVVDFVCGYGLEYAQKGGQGVVRSAFALAEVLFSYNPKLIALFEDCSLHDETLKKLRALSAARKKQPLEPSRCVALSKDALNIDGIIPAKPLGALVNLGEIMCKLQAPGWPERLDALQTIQSTISVRAITITGLGEPIALLRSRVQVEPHKNVLCKALEVVGLLGTSVGKEGKAFAKHVLPAVLARLAEKDKAARSLAKEASKAWLPICGHQLWAAAVKDLLLEGGCEDLREALLEHIGEIFLQEKNSTRPNSPNNSNSSWKVALLQPLFRCCIDSKKPAVRVEAERLLIQVFLPTVGHESMTGQCQKVLTVSDRMALSRNLREALGLPEEFMPEPSASEESCAPIEVTTPADRPERSVLADGRVSFASVISGTSSADEARRLSDPNRAQEMQEMKAEINRLRSMVEQLNQVQQPAPILQEESRRILTPRSQTPQRGRGEARAASPGPSNQAVPRHPSPVRQLGSINISTGVSGIRAPGAGGLLAPAPTPSTGGPARHATESGRSGRALTPRAASCERRRGNSIDRGGGYPAPVQSPARRTVGSASARARTPSAEGSRARSASATRHNDDFDIAGFALDLSARGVLSKQQRQQKERCQHWGPEGFAAEHLVVLKENFRACVGERLVKSMFAEKMQDQLTGLQIWNRHFKEHARSVLEILDMMLKWLTWMLSNTNTQVWKSTLELLRNIFDLLEREEVPLTDREAQILVINLVERSGHNLQIFRDGLGQLIHRLPRVYPAARLVPLLVKGLTSKNRKSIADTLQAIGDALDRPSAAGLAKSQKDLLLITKWLDDKDPDVRKSAVHVMVGISEHIDSSWFVRLCRGFSPSATQAVSLAISRCQPRPGSDNAADRSLLSSGGTPTRNGQNTCGRFSDVAQQEQPKGARSRIREEQRSARERSSSRDGKASRIPGPLAKEKPSPQKVSRSELSMSKSQSLHGLRTPEPKLATAPSPLRPVVMEELLVRSEKSECQFFSERCAEISRALSTDTTPEEALVVAEALLKLMHQNLGVESRLEQSSPLVDILEAFLSSRDRICLLPDETLRGLLLECLRNLNCNTWTKSLSNGTDVLKKLNLGCVMLLCHVSRTKAYSLILDIQLTEARLVSSSLLMKCVRKLNKNLISSRNPEAEIEGVIAALQDFMRKLQQKLQRPPEQRDLIDCPTAQHAEEIVSACCTQWPDIAQAVLAKHLDRNRETLSSSQSQYLKHLFRTSEAEKENINDTAKAASGSPQKFPPSEALAKARLERRLSSPGA